MAKEKGQTVVVKNNNLLLYVLVFLLGAIVATVILAVSSGVCNANFTGKAVQELSDDQVSATASYSDPTYFSTEQVALAVGSVYAAADQAQVALDMKAYETLEEVEMRLQQKLNEERRQFVNPLALQLFEQFSNEKVVVVMNRIMEERMRQQGLLVDVAQPSCTPQVDFMTAEQIRMNPEMMSQLVAMTEMGEYLVGGEVVNYWTCEGRFANLGNLPGSGIDPMRDDAEEVYEVPNF